MLLSTDWILVCHPEILNGSICHLSQTNLDHLPVGHPWVSILCIPPIVYTFPQSANPGCLGMASIELHRSTCSAVDIIIFTMYL